MSCSYSGLITSARDAPGEVDDSRARRYAAHPFRSQPVAAGPLDVTPVLIGILAYVALQLVVGLLVSRNIRSEADYLVAGRRLGYPLAVFSIFATWFGAETCIGAAGGVHAEGLKSTVQDPFGYAICVLAMGVFFAAPLWRRRLITLADLFRERYSRGVERVACILMIPTSILWAAAQLRAFGQVLAHNADGLSIPAAVAIATGVTLLYTVVGGMLADAWTDLLQGSLLMIGLVILLVLLLKNADAVAALRAIPEERLSFRDPGESVLSFMNRWAIPIVGSVMAQELIARVSAARSAVVARRSALLAGVIYLGFGLIPVLVGLIGPQLVPDLEDPEQILPAVAALHMSTFVYVLFVGVLVSAILSTVDSALLVAGSLLSHNLVVPLLPELGERGRLRAARSGVLLFGLIAFVLALTSDGVLELVEEASGFGSQGIFVIAVFGLFSRFGGRASAYAALLLGISVWVLAHFVLELPCDYLLALGAALAGYLAAARIGRSPVVRRSRATSA